MKYLFVLNSIISAFFLGRHSLQPFSAWTKFWIVQLILNFTVYSVVEIVIRPEKEKL